MITFEIIQKIWQMLGPPELYSQVAAHELDAVVTPAGHPLVTIDGEKHRHLLIPLEGNTAHFVEDRQSAGVHVEANEWGYEGKRRRYVDVVCLKPHLDGIFDLMLLDILTALPDDLHHPDRVCRRVLNQWREFLTIEPNRVPDKSILVGIWGEMWMLSQLAQRSLRAINIWTGPNGGRFDFFTGTTALEIKSTLQRRGITVTIHGHQQLEAPVGGTLFFGVLKLEETPVGGSSISDILDKLAEIGIDRRLVLTALMKVELPPNLIPQTDDFRFRLIDWYLYHVDDHFPKIVSASFKDDALPNGVLSINYQIDLSTQPPQPLDEDEKSRFLEQFANEMQ
ncbi:MAG TPA: PD-(D/E)XK motif protein [Ktedonobacteraceae bacterium]|nr:PD-(D/E)XK motif protein [Ktedonobacteraceae bacterium]